MRILSLAIIAILCVGMMWCAHAADSKEKRGGDVVVSAPRAIASRNSRPEIANRQRSHGKTTTAREKGRPAPRQQPVLVDSSIVLLRGKSKSVLQAETTPATELRRDPSAGGRSEVEGAATTPKPNATASRKAAPPLIPLPAEIDASAIRLVAAIDESPSGSTAPAALQQSPAARRKMPEMPMGPIAQVQWTARRPAVNQSGRGFSPLMSTPSLPTDLKPLPKSSRSANDLSTATTKKQSAIESSQRSDRNTGVSATMLPQPDTLDLELDRSARSSDFRSASTQPRRPVESTLDRDPAVSNVAPIVGRQRRSTDTSKVIPIAGSTPTQIPVAAAPHVTASQAGGSSQQRTTTRNVLQPTRVPDRLRPVATSRLIPAPEPVGSMPHPTKPSPLKAPFKPSLPIQPTDIGNINAITVAPSPRPQQRQANAEIQSVVHREEVSANEQHGDAIADLVVGALPLPSKRVVQVAAESEEEDVQELEAPVALAPPPTDQKGIAIPLKSAPGTDRATLEKHQDLVTLVANDAELRSVLRMIADHHKLNLVIGPDVTGPVTVSIRGARLDEVLDAILGVAGFHWHQSGNLLYVTGADAASLDPKVQGRRLQVYPLNYVAAADVQPVVTGLLSPVGKAHTSESDAVDQLKTRELLIVEDNEAGHQRVAQYLAQIDVPPRQVLVEAHVLQIDLDDEERYGVNLRGLARIAGAKVILEGSNFAEENPEGPSFAFRINGTDMGHLIEAIHTNTNSRTLASPKVSVVNRQTAKVQIGQRLPYAVATTTQTATIQNVQFLDVGIVLEVTPVITHDDQILMTVLPKVSGGKITESGFPEEDTTQVSTTVLMPDGSGLVIGGLIRETDTQSDAVVPVVGQIPVIKRLFNKRAAESRRNELVVALVTHIMHDANPVREKECLDLQKALPPHAASQLRYSPEIRYSNQ
ncbi:Type IV pilus biogenesis and competence protein PilQ precursor [Stieleria maiorica]|uniref:Type IV pilus biogenesis and competence protein PilQ n=1 Tax=Stieleria maiorica TaxID=2795974 RepID=A0A5B9MEK4_9BACT|nr:secretin N-terminal domain-containing protein [Stieleria maiorica]QEF99692.1 Type IV pilus biogenesis and competence protein PilQ precursor [Stieleria maiorica]